MAVDEAIVLVGGLGTRLRTVVSDVPKPLAPVAGRPFLAWVLDRLADENIRHVVLAAGYMAERVRDAIGGAWQGMQVDYSIESAPLGTGGAVRQACNMLYGRSTHVLNGDTFLRYRLEALVRVTEDAKACLGMALAEVPDVARYGGVECHDQRVIGFHEKTRSGPGYINAGCYYLADGAVSSLPDMSEYSFESEVLKKFVASGCVAGFQNTREFIDIGIPDDYHRAQDLFGGKYAH